MILTVTLNPSVEKTAIVEGLDINKINQITDYRMVLGPSAIYSALVIKVLQGEPYVLGFSGGIGGRYIKNFMDKNKIKSDMLYKDAETRFNLKIIDGVTGQTTTLLDDNFELENSDVKNYRHKLNNNIKDVNTIIINNNGMSDSIRTEIVERTFTIAKEENFKVVLSLSNYELRKMLTLSPYAVVVNESDLEELELAGYITTEELLLKLNQLVCQYSIKYLVYNAKDSIYFISKKKITKIHKKQCMTDWMDIEKELLVGVLGVTVSRKYLPERIIKIMGGVLNAFRIEGYPNVLMRKDIDLEANNIQVIEVYNNRLKKVRNI